MIDTNSQNVGEKLSELWATADGARSRPVRSWSNAETMLCILEACGDPPPGPDAIPPDRNITLGALIREGNELGVSRAPETRAFDFDEYRRDHAVRKATHAGSWTQFRRRHDPDFPPAA